MSARYSNTITAESKPVYGWIYDYWDADDWIKWHTLLIASYGLDDANTRLITAWDDAPFLAACISFRTFNSKFITYAQQNGFYKALFVGVLGLVGSVEATGANVVQALPSIVKTATNAIEDVGKYIVPIALVLGIFMIIYIFQPLTKGHSK